MVVVTDSGGTIVSVGLSADVPAWWGTYSEAVRAHAAALSDLAYVDGELIPSDYTPGTVADLEAWIATGPAVWALHSVKAHELANDNRVTAIEALEGAI